MEVKGVLDRIEDDKYAVILAEEIGREYIVDKNKISHDTRPGDWVVMTEKNGKIVKCVKDKNESINNSTRVENKMKRIRFKSSDNKFKKN
ncbi:DUF3006 family protein [Sinobaca sp. H24]|uniref:DUF3006 family protein n=1 Tax=Sinobaca sp. H24 TaxID=2923376 RepID=UPI0020795940|nr:DUF3006 family protein [Sinobaca sp. H24]